MDQSLQNIDTNAVFALKPLRGSSVTIRSRQTKLAGKAIEIHATAGR
jgi:hypothetical protein